MTSEPGPTSGAQSAGSRRWVAPAALNTLFAFLFLAPASYLPLSLLLFPFLGWRKTALRSPALYCVVLFPIAMVSQLTVANDINMKELLRVFEIVLFLVFATTHHIEERINAGTVIILVAVVVVFALPDLFPFEVLKQIKESVWPVVGNWDYGTFGGRHFRVGSIYRNPNIFAQAMVLLIPFLILSDLRRITTFVLPLLAALIVLTGSRTCFVVIVLQIGWYLLSTSRGHESRRDYTKMLTIAGITAIVVYVVTSNKLELVSSRVLNLWVLLSGGEGAAEKARMMAIYADQLAGSDSLRTAWRMVFGNGAVEMVEGYRVDSELGYALYSVGGFGVIVVLNRLVSLWRYATQRGAGEVNLVWLVSVGGTTLFSFRFLLIVLLLYSIVHSRLKPTPSGPLATIGSA